VPPGKTLVSGYLYLGSPVKQVREFFPQGFFDLLISTASFSNLSLRSCPIGWFYRQKYRGHYESYGLLRSSKGFIKWRITICLQRYDLIKVSGRLWVSA